MSSLECRVSGFGFIHKFITVFLYALLEHVLHTHAGKWHDSRACEDNSEVSGARSSNLTVNHMRLALEALRHKPTREAGHRCSGVSSMELHYSGVSDVKARA